MLEYTKEIRTGFPVVFKRELDLSDKEYLNETYGAVVDCFYQIPYDISRDEWLGFMMQLTKGTVNPSIILEVYDKRGQGYYDL